MPKHQSNTEIVGEIVKELCALVWLVFGMLFSAIAVGFSVLAAALHRDHPPSEYQLPYVPPPAPPAPQSEYPKQF